MINLKSHTGLIQADFDHVFDPESFREKLINDPFVFVLFRSASGNGLKMILKIDPKKHQESFKAVSAYFAIRYGLQIDPVAKDVTRLCYYSHDPEIFLNENASVFLPDEFWQSKMYSQELYTDVEQTVQKIEKKALDITKSYDDWLNIGFAIADSFGNDGEHFYHRISKWNPGYEFNIAHKQFLNCLNSGNEGITIRTFFKLSKDHGIDIGKQATNERQVEKEDKSAGQIKFYKPEYDKYKKIKGIIVDYPRFIDLLYTLGFRRFDMDKNYIFVRIENQIVTEVTLTWIQDEFIRYLESLPEKQPDEVTRKMIIEKFYKSPAHYFCENRLNLLKSKHSFEFNNDLPNDCFIYFQNGYVSCSQDGYQIFPYKKLKGLIWENQMINRNFEFKEETEENRSVFSAFIWNIANKDADRYFSLCSIIGYCLHSFYDGKLQAILFTDSKISDSPDGRTGKTLLCQALGKIKNYCEINGKDFDFTNKHKYQQANLDTQVIHLNDVKKNFDIEQLFNDITEGVVVDKKNLKPFRIKTKLLISTNKTVRIEGASAKDRVVEFEFANHYNDKFSPQDEFGHWFFRDWNAEQWNCFDNFMMSCICLYLKKGILQAQPINLNRRKLLEFTCSEFTEFMDHQVSDSLVKPFIEYDKKELHNRFLSEYPEFAESRQLKYQRNFTRWLRLYAKYSGHFAEVNSETDERKSGSNFYITFRTSLKDENIT